MNLKTLEDAIKRSWTRDTCYPDWAEHWSFRSPEYGQCLPTAMVVQDYKGGDLAYCSHHQHYWNILPDGRDFDLTRSQFREGTKFCVDNIRSREDLLTSPTAIAAGVPERYLILKKRVEKILENYKKP